MKKIRDISGQIFGALTAITFAYRKPTSTIWRCVCSCGTYKEIASGDLLAGKVLSCGCRHGTKMRTHGATGTAEYRIWNSMHQRCLNRKNAGYYRYGGRGITITPRWLGANGFKNFIKDMGPRPGLAFSLDRKNNNKGYSKGNCRWATREEQSNNKRGCRYVTYKGKTQTVSQWAREVGVSGTCIKHRITKLGWSAHKALTTPSRKAGSF